MTTSEPISLRPVTPDNIQAVLKLAVHPEQQQFVATNAVSLAQAYVTPAAWPRAIYLGETPAGFVMLSVEPGATECHLWRYMVDARFQRTGVGSRALEQVIAHVRSLPGMRRLLLSYVPAEGSPEPFYRRLGFAPTGDLDEGEVVMALEL